MSKRENTSFHIFYLLKRDFLPEGRETQFFLLEITRDYQRLLKITRITGLPEITKITMRLLKITKITKDYQGLPGITKDYQGLPGD